jgi:hypothetical protein
MTDEHRRAGKKGAVVHLSGTLFEAALLALIVAAALAFAADYPPVEARLNWRYPVLVIGVALTNIALTVLLILRPDPATGAVLLTVALLLIYAGHRRARVAAQRRPPHHQRPR